MWNGPLAALLPLLLLHLQERVHADVVFTAEPCERASFGLRPIQGDVSRYKQCGPSSQVWIVPCTSNLSFDPVERVCKEMEEPQLHRRMEKFQGRSKRPVITTPKPAPEEFVFSTVRPKRPKKGKKKTTTSRPTTTQKFGTEIFPEEPIRPAQPQPAFPKPGAFSATTIRPEYTVKYNGENMTEEELLRRLVDLVKAQKATAAKEKSVKEERERQAVERQVAEEQRLAREREEAEERKRLVEERRRVERLEMKRKDEEKKKKWEDAQRKKEEERRLAVERAEAARKKAEEEQRRKRIEEEEMKWKVEEEERRKKKLEEEERRLKMEEEEERTRREEEDRLRREQEERLAIERAEMERIEEQRRAAIAKAEQEQLEQIRRIEEAKREQERLRKEEKEKRDKENEELIRRERERAERIRQEMERQLEEERDERERQLLFNRHATTTVSPDFEIIRFPPTPRHGSVVPPLPQTTTTTVSPWITSPDSWKPPVDVFSSFERADRMKTTAAPKLLNGCIPNGDCPFSYDGDHFCAHPDNPSMYLQCAPMIGRRGRWTARRCPDELLFSTHLGRCEKDPYSAYNPNQRVVIPRLPEETQTVSWQGNREIITVTPVYPRSNGIHNTIDSFPRDLLPVVAPIHPGDLFKPRQAHSEFDDYEELDLSKIHPLFPRVQPSFINNFLPFQPFQEGEKGKDEDNIIGAVFKPFLKKVALKQTKHFLDRVLSDDEIEKIEQEANDRLRGEGTSRN